MIRDDLTPLDTGAELAELVALAKTATKDTLVTTMQQVFQRLANADLCETEVSRFCRR